MTGNIFSKLVLKTIVNKLEQRIQELDDAGTDHIPFSGHVKKEKDKYSTYLRQVRDILNLFEK